MNIASGALLLWPLVALGLYLAMPAGRATIWTLLGGYLLLPVVTSFEFPGLPSLDKESIPSLCVLILAPLMAKRGEFRWPRSTTINVLLLLIALVPIGTTLNNREPISIGSVTMPGLNLWETLSFSIANMLGVVPFVLGAAMLNTERGHRELLKVLVLAALAYSLPVLAEVRLSPFLLQKVYGVENGLWLQQMRDGGFRAMVFLGHGLLISIFFAMATMASMGLRQMKVRLFSLPMGLIAAYLLVVLLLNKSLGPVMMLAAVLPLFLFLSSRKFLTFVMIIAAMFLTYPLLRGMNLMPVQAFTQTIASFNADRAASFKFRVDNEELLLHRAAQKPWFGWGRFGRSRVLVLTDWGETRDVTTTDAAWIISIGISGWIGYLAGFGLLTYPFWHAFRLRKLQLPVATVALVAVLLLNVLDLIPNSSLRSITWLIAGAIAGMTRVSMRRTPVNNVSRGQAAPPGTQPQPAI